MPRSLLIVLIFLAASCRSAAPERLLTALTMTPVERFDPAVELGKCITIDRVEDVTVDGKPAALVCFRSHIDGDVPHLTVEQAVQNLEACPGTKFADPVSIAGYGVIGAISVGGGADFFDPLKKITFFSDEWHSTVDDLDDGTGTLTLLSCLTGAEKRGADLLFALTRLTGRPVRARTGLTYCNPRGGIYFQAGSEWQEASPADSAPREGKPYPKPQTRFTTPETIILGGTPIRTEKIRFVELSENLSGREIRPLAREDGDASTMKLPSIAVSLIDFANPFTVPGEPLAPVTATVDLKVGLFSSRRVLIYGDVLARDAEDPDRFFDVDPILTTKIVGMRLAASQ